ncbi:MAG TPA: hypothetical protein ENL42_06500 [Thermoplasmatales archaeon]|nr:hypothetical protein [Thermoplasmatales archaeon]
MKKLLVVAILILLLMPLNQSREEGFNAKTIPTKEDVFGFILALQKRVATIKFLKPSDLMDEIVAETDNIDYFLNEALFLEDAMKEFYEAEGISYTNESISSFMAELNSSFSSEEIRAISLLLLSYAHAINATSRQEQIDEVLHICQNVRKAAYILSNCSLNRSISDAYDVIMLGSSMGENYGGEYKFIIDFGGNDKYEKRNNSFLLDLKGNDSYGAFYSNEGVSLAFDIDGNDEYVNAPYAEGGICFLVDGKGDDKYKGTAASSWNGGISFLLDLNGNDVYDGESLTQSYSNNAFSFLADIKGDDIYQAKNRSQACSEDGGISLLLDLYGNDAFFADDYSQAYANGFPHTSISLFINLAGDDYYEAGSFSQGYGEKGGMAFLFDFLGEDGYCASQFSQASSAWLGMGVLLDSDGKNKFLSSLFSQGSQRWGGYSFFLQDFDSEDIYEMLQLPERIGIDLWNLLGNFF